GRPRLVRRLRRHRGARQRGGRAPGGDRRHRRGPRIRRGGCRGGDGPRGFRGSGSERDARAAWMAVLQPAYEALREKVVIAERFGGEPPWLDAYGAQSPGEFFAVACEGFFVNRPAPEAD